jgi:ankyrin repeat protein
MCSCMQDEIGDISLINACQGGHVKTARVLLDHGAATDHRNKVYFYAFRHETILTEGCLHYSMANQLFTMQAPLVRQSV